MARNRELNFQDWRAITDKICIENLGKYQKFQDLKDAYDSGMTPLQAYEKAVKSNRKPSAEVE